MNFSYNWKIQSFILCFIKNNKCALSDLTELTVPGLTALIKEQNKTQH